MKPIRIALLSLLPLLLALPCLVRAQGQFAPRDYPEYGAPVPPPPPAYAPAAPYASRVRRPRPTATPDDEAPVSAVDFGGPRVGVAYLTGAVADSYVNSLNASSPAMALFGWQMEWDWRPVRNSDAFVMEFIPMVGGLDQGLCIPSASYLVGMRDGRMWEFGAGPSWAPGGLAYTVALGHTFVAGGIRVPLDVSYRFSKGGGNLGLTLGFNIFNNLGLF